METIKTIGRRKTAIARIGLSAGKGDILINKKPLKTYLPVAPLQVCVQQPFTLLELEGKYDVVVNATGGGLRGQAEAIRLAIARALCELDPENRPPLKKMGLLTRDPRMVERKKYGQKKARKKFQFSKR